MKATLTVMVLTAVAPTSGAQTGIVHETQAKTEVYVLDPSTNTARRTQIAMSFVSSGGAGGRGGRGGQGASGVGVYVSPDARRETEAKAIREGELKTHVTSSRSRWSRKSGSRRNSKCW